MSTGFDRALAAMDRQLPSGAVVTDRDLLETYAHDASDVPGITPRAAVRATSAADVVAVLRAANEHAIPVTPRAGGTSRVGGAVPVAGGIVLSMDKMSAVLEVDRAEMIATVEPGLVTGELHRVVEADGLFYPPDPNSWATCTIGGNVATNAGGPRAFKYGVTRDYVLGMRIVTATGQELALGRRTKKGVTGYDLTSLMVGSEGTLGVVTEVTLRLVPRPEAVSTLLVLLSDEAGIADVTKVALDQRIVPRCIELLDAWTLDLIRGSAALSIPAEARALLIVELDGDEASVERDTETVGNALLAGDSVLDVLVARHGGDRERLWSARRDMSHTIRKLAAHKMSEDVVVPRMRLHALLEKVRQISDETRIRMPAYGHAGDGNLHVNYVWDDDDERRRVEVGIRRLFEEVITLGGTLSGEHGIGVSKAPYLGLEQSPELIALEERIKTAFDPKGILNPGKIFPASAKRYHGAC